MTITVDQIPPEVVEVTAQALCKDARLFWPDLTADEQDVFHGEARAAIVAALNAWPGVSKGDACQWSVMPDMPILILPLTQETK